MATFEQIISDLKNKIYKPIYFLMGDESFYIDKITNYIDKNTLPEEEKSFNQTILYGKDTDMGTLLNTARRFPMMSNYNVVILKEAQNLKGIEGQPADKIDPFLLYAENPPKSTIMVINLKEKSLHKGRKLYKTLEKTGVVFESKRIYENKVGAWIIKYLKDEGYTIDIKAAELMAAHLGNNLSKVVQEIEKLTIVVPKGSKITLKDIEENIGISKDFNVFELQAAIAKRDVYRSNLIITHLGQNPKTKSIIPLIAFLYSYFTKLLMIHSSTDRSNQALASVLGVPPFFIRDYMEAARNYSKGKCIHIIGFLREYDTKSKGIDSPSIDDLELMREFIYKIVHIQV